LAPWTGGRLNFEVTQNKENYLLPKHRKILHLVRIMGWGPLMVGPEPAYIS